MITFMARGPRANAATPTTRKVTHPIIQQSIVNLDLSVTEMGTKLPTLGVFRIGSASMMQLEILSRKTEVKILHSANQHLKT